MRELEWILGTDLRTVTAVIPADPPTSTILNTAAVDRALAVLGELRAHMTPEIQRDMEGRHSVRGVRDPLWTVEPDPLMGDSIFHIRDPRFGWLHYLIPRSEARKLGECLIAQADTPPPGSEQVFPG